MRMIRYCVFVFFLSLHFSVACQATKAPEKDIRGPAVAGKFYPSSPERLRLAIEKFLQDAVPKKVKDPVAIIVPHAGYIYSGQICADAFKQVSNENYDVVIILGTNHTNPNFKKISLYLGNGFRTPLGIAPIDRGVISALVKEDPTYCIEERSLHEYEHSVEVVVPFVQVAFPRAHIVPVVVGSPDVEMCTRFGETLARVLKHKRALIVASSDLSHYPESTQAKAIDKKTLEYVTKLDPVHLHNHLEAQMKKAVPNLVTCACGEAPILTAMVAARSLGATTGHIISYMNSGDTLIGDRSRVVGYGAVVFTKENISQSDLPGETPVRHTKSLAIGPQDQKALLSFARETLSRFFSTDTVPVPRGFAPHLSQLRGVFVTLKKKGELRGCIGRIIPDRPIPNLVGALAIEAAFNDMRFSPLTADELSHITVEISILTPPREVSGVSEIVPGRDGVILQKGSHSAVFLPQVATEHGWTREEMLDHLCLKAGLEKKCWVENAHLSTFQALVFSE